MANNCVFDLNDTIYNFGRTVEGNFQFSIIVAEYPEYIF